MLLALLMSGCGSIDDGGVQAQPSHPAQPTPTSTSLPTITNTLSPTQTSISGTPTLGIGSTMIGKDNMVLLYVPAGEFLMGSNDKPLANDQSPSYYDNYPQHSVTLDAFWIDQTEVTNKQYVQCVAEKACILPLDLKSPMRSSYYGDPQFENYPVIYVEWGMAKTYCEWAGRRLPTEAEWEKAARGMDGRIYPWGNDSPNDNLLNYNSAERDTTEVGTYPNGKSPYGALDMAGNVWEWVNDWYDGAYYQNSPSSNPLGPEVAESETGYARVLRGGSWYFEEGSFRSIFRAGVIPVDDLVRSDMRSGLVPVYADTSIYGKPPLGLGTVGIRCAMSATQ
jgi:serine/threonine-protein kinase